MGIVVQMGTLAAAIDIEHVVRYVSAMPQWSLGLPPVFPSEEVSLCLSTPKGQEAH